MARALVLMPLFASFVTLVLCACTAHAPPVPVEGEEKRAQEAPPTIDDADKPLELAPGELVRVRGGGGACGGGSLLVVFADGRFTDTSREGCYAGRPGDPPPPPSVEADRLGWRDYARLSNLLADPTLGFALEGVHGSGGGSAHPSRHDVLVLTPTGLARGRHVGVEMEKESPLFAFIGGLYERLYPCPPGLCDD